MPYKFPSKIQEELSAFDYDDVGQVADEIRICKMLLRRAVEHGYSSLANSICATISRLTSVQIGNQVRMGQLLEAVRSGLSRSACVPRFLGVSKTSPIGTQSSMRCLWTLPKSSKPKNNSPCD